MSADIENHFIFTIHQEVLVHTIVRFNFYVVIYFCNPITQGLKSPLFSPSQMQFLHEHLKHTEALRP